MFSFHRIECYKNNVCCTSIDQRNRLPCVQRVDPANENRGDLDVGLTENVSLLTCTYLMIRHIRCLASDGDVLAADACRTWGKKFDVPEILASLQLHTYP